ncbi:MAG: hypothetical protein NT080_00050 [Spirochaetes bacterium]|nr:hypothetical protein [Spirochaetota bacterium]
MSYEYTKSSTIKLRDAGLDEKWLQDRINEDPSILGLGDLVIFQKERKQPTGGRIDFLMYDPEELKRYEIEVMLGTLDESHIIRTIEYWDIERHRNPNVEHIAVIIAEDITNRFFNIISLLNKAVPIIAIQLNAFILEKKLCLNFTKVLNLVQEDDPLIEENNEATDRKYWESRANPNSLKVMDAIISIFSEGSNKRKITYNKGHIAFGTIGNNFTWFHPRKGSRCHCEIRLNPEERETIKVSLEEKGLECGLRGTKNISLMLTIDEFNESKDLISSVFLKAEEYSNR